MHNNRAPISIRHRTPRPEILRARVLGVERVREKKDQNLALLLKEVFKPSLFLHHLHLNPTVYFFFIDLMNLRELWLFE